MVEVIGVRFRTTSKIYHFNPEGVQYIQGQFVIVETPKGIECGEVVIENRDMEMKKEGVLLKKIIRLATDEDHLVIKENKDKEKEAFFICKHKIIKHELNMKLIDVEYTFDRNKLLFYFTSDERVDFRDLVKDLASIFKTRIELRQIGVRDETKMCGGIGICGRGLCCNTFLTDFAPVSIKMAKDQNLSLNPIKISGICGRLMCCLKYEEDCYIEIRDKLPEVGESVFTPDGKGEVLAVNVLREQIKVAVKKKDSDEKEAVLYSSEQIKLIRKGKKKCNHGCNSNCKSNCHTNCPKKEGNSNDAKH
ncbi:MAG: stage 0 sporulation protein [Epulopiscium sp. Nele67-Bin005]|nr:MAG: stage 0 sporulation protein [Epulopiscium sp. Nele67-Bin005]